MMRANRSTLAKLCLLTALAVPVQRSAFAAVVQGNPEVDSTQLLIAQDSAETAPRPAASSLENDLTATTDEAGLVIIQNAEGETVAGPLSETGGEVTALAFSDDGETLATGTQTGQVRFWSIDGEPKGDIFQPVVGEDNEVTTLRFEDNETLFVGASQGRQGLWGLDGLPPGEIVADGADGAIAPVEAADVDGPPWWVWLIPLLGILGLGWLFLGKRRTQTAETEARRQTSPTVTVPPPTTDPETDREVSSRAQTIISTDRVTDESRVVGTSGSTPSTATVPGSNLPNASHPNPETSSLDESTDLESPDLEGTNLDLSTASMALGGLSAGGAALGNEILGNEILGNEAVEDDAFDSSSATTDLENDDPWDDNLELTLDDEPASELENEPVAPSAESILSRNLQQEPTESPAVEMPSVETSALEEAAAPGEAIEEVVVEEPINQAPLEAPPIVETPPVLERPPVAETPPVVEVSPVVEVPPVVEAPAAETPTIETPTIETPSDDTPIIEMTLGEVSAPDSESEFEGSLKRPLEVLSSNIDNIEPTRDTVIAETETILDIEPTRETIIGDSAVIFSGVAAAGLSTVAAPIVGTVVATESQTSINNGETTPLTIEDLASVDSGLADLPEGYGESRIVLLPRDPEWAYAYWDVSNEHKEKLRQQGGQRLVLRLYDVTDLDLASQSPHSMQQVDCHEMARSWYLEMPVSDRDYLVEIGYLTDDDRWLLLARSAPIRVPPIYPSDWVKDQFVTIDWKERLTGRSFGDLGQPHSPEAAPAKDSEATDLPKIYDNLFTLTQSQEALRVAGSLYGSMQQTPPGALSASGGVLAGPMALNASGLNMSGLNMSGIGSGASELPGRSRKFWLVADAELIVYGATEPDATLMVGDKVVPLNPDGTFRFHVAFPDGQIDYPIRAVAADGEQTRSVRLNFERETPERNTNTKAEAQDEWF